MFLIKHEIIYLLIIWMKYFRESRVSRFSNFFSRSRLESKIFFSSRSRLEFKKNFSSRLDQTRNLVKPYHLRELNILFWGIQYAKCTLLGPYIHCKSFTFEYSTVFGNSSRLMEVSTSGVKIHRSKKIFFSDRRSNPLIVKISI